MTQHIPWQLAFEALAYVPHTLGFRPADSAVVVTYEFREGYFHLGPTARFDIDVLGHAAGREFAVGVLDTLASSEPAGALVAVYGERPREFWAEGMRLLSAAWPFAEHGGYFHVSEEEIAALGGDGGAIERRDPLELAATVVAMQVPGGGVGQDESALRLERQPREPEGLDEARARIAALDPERTLALWSRSLKRAVTRSEVDSDEALLACIQGLDNPYVRDGFIGWVLSGLTLRGPLDEISPMEFLGSAEPPPREALRAAQDALAVIARTLPEGTAASALASAAYLAWYSGFGARARILATQAAEENPRHTLARLVLDIVAASCPPPWVSRTELPWRISSDPAA